MSIVLGLTLSRSTVCLIEYRGVIPISIDVQHSTSYVYRVTVFSVLLLSYPQV